MRFTKVVMNDFMSYSDQEIELDGLDYVAIAGSNGSGKSSIALAIAWALFGTIRVKGDGDSVVRDGQKECAVILEFDADGGAWRIERAKVRTKSAKVRLLSKSSAGEWLPYGDHLNATAQARIEELVGMSEDAFFSLIVIDGQSGARFVKADSTLRRDILLNLLPELAVWGQMENRARDELTAARAAVENDRTRIESDEERIADAKANLDEVAEELAGFDIESLPDTLAKVEADIAKQERKVEAAATAEQKALDDFNQSVESRERELKAEVTSARANLESARSKKRAVENVSDDLEDVSKRAEKASEAVAAATATHEERVVALREFRPGALQEADELIKAQKDATNAASVLRAQVRADRKSLDALAQMQEAHEATCPTCQTHLGADAVEALVKRLSVAIDEASAEIDEHEEAARRAKDEGDKIATKIDRASDAVDSALRTLDSAREAVVQFKEDIDRLERRLVDLLDEYDVSSVKELAAALDEHSEAHDEAVDAYESYADDVEEKRRSLADAVKQAQEHARTGKDGQRLSELRESRRSIADKIRAADVLSGREKTLKDSIRTLTESMRTRQDGIKGALERIDALEQVVLACRPQGIPSMLLDGVLAPIEVEASRILSAVPGGEGMTLRFEQSRALKSKAGAKEVLDIIVTLPTGTERPIESLSAGETVRVSLALVFAMIGVLGQRRGGDALDAVFLDEPLGPLDQEAVPAFVEVLRSAVSAGTLSSVMVVTHDQRVVEALPQRIEVHRDDTGVSIATLVA